MDLIERLDEAANDHCGDWEGRLFAEAAAALWAVQEERVDWARRFLLNGVTPWQWQTRAITAEQRERDLREALRRIAINCAKADALSTNGSELDTDPDGPYEPQDTGGPQK